MARERIMIMLAIIIVLGLAGLIITVVRPVQLRVNKPFTTREVRRRPF